MLLEETMQKSIDDIAERLERIEANTRPQQHRLTKEEILAVKDRGKRQQLIAENMDLFK